MISLADYRIAEDLTAALQTWAADPATWTPLIFDDLPADAQGQIITALGAPGRLPAVHVGYPTGAVPSIPSIWIIGEGGGEQPQDDVIGQAWGTTTTPYGEAADLFGVFTEQTWRLDTYSTNALGVLALTGLVRWALYRQRQAWGALPLNFVRQVVRWGAWGPVPDSMQDVVFPFTRPIFFTVTVPDLWTAAPPPVITAVDPVTLS